MTISRPRTEAPRRRPPTPRLGRSGTRGARAAFLGTGPTAWYDARDLLVDSQQTLTNRVGAGSAQLGSTSGSDTNDPSVITHSGTNRLVFPNNASNYLFMTNPVGWAAGEYTGVVDATPAVGWNIAGNHRLMTMSDGATNATIMTNTSSIRLFGSSTSINSVGHPTSGRVQWRIRRNGNTSASIAWRTDGVVDPNASGWTVSATGAITDGTSNVAYIGDFSGSDPWAGEVHYAAAWDSTPTLKWSINPATETPGQTTFGTWTVNRATSGLTTAIVTRPILAFDGSDDYLQLPTAPTFTAAAGNHTVMLVNRVHNLAGAATLSRAWSSESASNNGAHIYLDQTSAQYKVLVGGATTTATTAAATFTASTQLHAVAAVFAAGTAYAYTTTTGLTAGTSYSGVGTITHATPRVASRADSVANPADLEVYAVATWDRALTATELATAATYLLGSYA